MKFEILHQEKYSRGQLLLRSFFGIFYILIPHFFVLYFLFIWGAILRIYVFFAILFTGKYPENAFNYFERLLRWNYRVTARLLNLADGYPAFGLDAKDDRIILEIDRPEKLSRSLLLLKVFFGGIYVALPHFFVLFFRFIVTYVYVAIAWFAVLFTGKYPKKMHEFVVGTLRWSLRINLYLTYLMTDKYPPFNGRPDESVA